MRGKVHVLISFRGSGYQFGRGTIHIMSSKQCNNGWGKGSDIFLFGKHVFTFIETSDSRGV